MPPYLTHDIFYKRAARLWTWYSMSICPSVNTLKPEPLDLLVLTKFTQNVMDTFFILQSASKETHIQSRVFLWHPSGRGPKICMVSYVIGRSTKKLSMYRTPIYIIDHVNFWPPASGGSQKNSDLNVRFF